MENLISVPPSLNRRLSAYSISPAIPLIFPRKEAALLLWLGLIM